MSRALVTLLALSACAEPELRVGGADPLEVMREVNDAWIAAHRDDPGDNKWARAVYAIGNMAAYETLGVPEYLAHAIDWADRADWGINRGTGTRHADDHTAGQVYLAIHDIDPQPFRVAAITDSTARMIASEQRDDWWWIDAFFMASPVFARLGEMTGDERYHRTMHELYVDARDRRGLYDRGSGLWFRDPSYLYPELTTAGGHRVFWSRGNGWVMGSLILTLDRLAPDSPHRADYESMLAEMAAAVAARQRADGFWTASLDDPDQYPGPESSGTALFAYALAGGVNRGLLDRATYEPVVARAWDALVNRAMLEGGWLGYVQGVGEAPSSSQPVERGDTADFGTGVFLLAASEVAALGI